MFPYIVKVILIHKKDSKLDFSNYNPVSPLSNLNKLVEKFPNTRISKFLSDNNFIHPFQFGFWQKHSTTHALISLTEIIRKNLDEWNIACGIFCRGTEASWYFLAKMENYDVRSIANEWCQSYLSNRKQYVSINGYDSNWFLFFMVLSVYDLLKLCPFLFLIYISMTWIRYWSFVKSFCWWH